MIRKKASVSIVLVIVAFAFSMFLGGLMGGEEAFAGGWISTNGSYGGGSGGGGGGSGDSNIDSNGASWIYYSASGLAAVDIQTTPRHHGSVVVPAECAQPGHGFWAFGIGGKGEHNNFYIYEGHTAPKNHSSDQSTEPNFGSTTTEFLMWRNNKWPANERKQNVYSTSNGGRGLVGVIPWGYKGGMSQPYSKNHFAVHGNGSLSHALYHNNGDGTYTWIYSATAYGDVATVLDHYKVALQYTNGQVYTGSTIPDDLQAFCYWEGMRRQVTLTMIHLNAEDNGGIWGMDNNSTTVGQFQSATVWRRGPPNADWRFLSMCDPGWCGSYGMGGNLGYGDSVTDPQLTDDRTVYAMYGPRRFQGLAQAKSGSLDSSTGWTFNSSDAAISVDCPNTGCQALFNLGLLKTWGPNSTHYSIDKYDSYSGWTTIQSITETYNADGRSLVYTTEDMKPGQKICYYLSWEPWGPYGREEYQTVSACATAKISNFQGKSSVTGAASGTTDWQSSYKRQSVFIYNCSPLTGCDVYFNHRMRRNPDYAGNSDQNGTLGWSDFKISRTSNMTTSDKRISNDDNVDSGTFYASWGERQVGVTTGPFKLYPGMVLCETLSFRNNNMDGLSSPNTDTKACASALGNAQPPDPAPSECDVASDCVSDPNGDQGNDALTDIEVKNTSVTKYNTYRRVVYAKPTDEIWYRASYNPNVQYTFFLKPEQMRIENGSIRPGSNSINTTKSMGTMFNEIRGQRLGWKNAIIVRSLYFQSLSYSRSHIFEEGDISKRTETTNPEFVNKHKVVPSEVGLSLNENSEFNYSGNSRIMTTPTQVEFTANGQWNLGTVSIPNHFRTAYARIPYNYDTAITIPEPEPKDPENPDDPESPMPNTKKPEIAYAGEKKEIEVVADIIPKYNRVTMNSEDDEPYATKTSRSTIKIIVYIADSPSPGIDSWPVNSTTTRDADLCTYYGKVKGKSGDGTNWQCGQFDLFTRVDNVSTTNLNNNGNMDGATHKWNTSFNAPDLDAGKHICVATALYPANSGPAINYNDSDGSHTWRISDSRCYVIAKRPNLQVLGGGVFSAGKLSTSISEKKNLYGIYETEIASGINTTVFGSWGEHQVTSMGIATGFASGASTGYFGSTNPNPPQSNRTPIAGVGGSKEGENVFYCIRTPLTFANMYPCSYNSYAGNFTNGGAASPINVKDKDKLIAKFTQNQEFSGVSYQKIEGDATVGATTVGVGMTEVIHATGDITITGNITYASGPYQKLGDIPKMIIYAEKNIKIDCGVNTINAVLIAGKTNRSYSGTVGIVDTCPTEFSRYNNNLESEVNWKYKESGADITLINSRRNSNPLRIIGTVIANRLSANRTYGAAKGVNSVVPAEVINYDTSLYLWGARESESSASGRLQTVYKHELAPRY